MLMQISQIIFLIIDIFIVVNYGSFSNDCSLSFIRLRCCPNQQDRNRTEFSLEGRNEGERDRRNDSKSSFLTELQTLFFSQEHFITKGHGEGQDSGKSGLLECH